MNFAMLQFSIDIIDTIIFSHIFIYLIYILMYWNIFKSAKYTWAHA